VRRLHTKRSTLEAERPLLSDLGQVMRDASICGLGQTASLALESAARKLARAIDEETR
jgi:NADH:ubiquinone oxidoreductase subunit F (NADH-binding)